MEKPQAQWNSTDREYAQESAAGRVEAPEAPVPRALDCIVLVMVINSSWTPPNRSGAFSEQTSVGWIRGFQGRSASPH